MDSFMYSQDVRGGNTFVKFHQHDLRNIIHMMIGHDTQWSKAPSCKRQATKGCITEFVFYFYLRNGTLTIRICRIISNPGYYTSKNHLERSRPEGRSFTKHLPVLTPTEARAPAIKCCIPPSVNPMRTLFFTAEKTFLGGPRLCWLKHTSQKRTTSVMSVVCFVNKVEQAFAHELPTTIPWWRLQKKKPKSNYP